MDQYAFPNSIPVGKEEEEEEDCSRKKFNGVWKKDSVEMELPLL